MLLTLMDDDSEIVQYDVKLMTVSLLWNVPGIKLEHYYGTNVKQQLVTVWSCKVHKNKVLPLPF